VTSELLSTEDFSGESCPLCASSAVAFYHSDERRDYIRCANCGLVFVPKPFHLAAQDEKANYDLHENNPEDQGYRMFLARLFDVLEPKLAPASSGLDFGCGPGPTLSLMFAERGHRMALYDIFYAPDRAVLEKRYAFITATEVVEHLSSPGEVLDELWRLLEPKGWLGIMTKLVRDREAFASWHYKNDPTHICFFSRQTFAQLGTKWQASMEFVGADVVLFQKA